jgi:creatinine amidohydrolase
VETSWSLALFPELMHQEWAVDTEPKGFLPEGHIDKAGNLLHRPIAWYGHVGGGPIEVVAYPEGVVGKATLASADKAKEGVEALLDYLEKLVRDIMERFPPGKLPPAEMLSQRPKEELDALTKEPLTEGWRNLYTAGNLWG